MITLTHYLVLAAVLFALGTFAVISKKNLIGILIGIELMLNAVNINLIAFSRYITPQALLGQVFAIFTIIVAAAEVAVGLAVALALYRIRKSINADEMDILRW